MSRCQDCQTLLLLGLNFVLCKHCWGMSAKDWLRRVGLCCYNQPQLQLTWSQRQGVSWGRFLLCKLKLLVGAMWWLTTLMCLLSLGCPLSVKQGIGLSCYQVPRLSTGVSTVCLLQNLQKCVGSLMNTWGKAGSAHPVHPMVHLSSSLGRRLVNLG